MADISAADAIRLAQEDSWLLDVREPHEWQRGRSPLAHNIPLSQLNDRFTEIPQDRPILVVCHAGSRSLRAALALRQAGYDAENVSGGMVAWEQACGALVADGPNEPQVD